MLDGPLVFLDIDTQRDFMEPTGALHVPRAGEIIDNLARLTAFALDRRIPILATADAHSPDEPDPEPFPPHCLAGTPGQHRIAATACPGGMVLAPDAPFDDTPELPAHLTIEKTRYDVFTHPEADRVFSRYAAADPTFVVYGVATDYCVRAAIEGLLARGLRVALVVDAIRPVDPAAEPALLTDWARRGVFLTRTEIVTS